MDQKYTKILERLEKIEKRLEILESKQHTGIRPWVDNENQHMIVCPNCKNDSTYTLQLGITKVNCRHCNSEIEILLGKVRAKRGRQIRGSRNYFLRFLIGDLEKTVEFWQDIDTDLDMRSGDIFSINTTTNSDQNSVDIYDKFQILQNHTTNEFAVSWDQEYRSVRKLQ